jgi:hypothetical protein
MFNIELSLNVLTLAIIVLGACLAGFVSRSPQMRKKQVKIMELRREMIKNHAQILELQKEYVSLEYQMRSGKAPVLPIKTVVIDLMEEEKKVADRSI